MERRHEPFARGWVKTWWQSPLGTFTYSVEGSLGRFASKPGRGNLRKWWQSSHRKWGKLSFRHPRCLPFPVHPVWHLPWRTMAGAELGLQSPYFPREHKHDRCRENVDLRVSLKASKLAWPWTWGRVRRVRRTWGRTTSHEKAGEVKGRGVEEGKESQELDTRIRDLLFLKTHNRVINRHAM